MTNESFDICCEEILSAEKKNNIISITTQVLSLVYIMGYIGYLLSTMVSTSRPSMFEITVQIIFNIVVLVLIGLISMRFVHKNIRQLIKRQEKEGVLAMLRPYVSDTNGKFYLVFKPFSGRYRVRIELSENEFFTYFGEFVKCGDDNYLVFTKNENLFQRRYEVVFAEE